VLPKARFDSFKAPVNLIVTLPRTLEPQPDDPGEEARQYLGMDHSTVNRVFVDELLAGGAVGTHVIDLGCGPAQIPIELCRRDAAVSVMALDAEVEMLEIAKCQIDIAGMLERISLAHVDVNEMTEFHDAIADTVISNSLLHHLADPLVGLAACRRLVRPGGRIFVRDLARPHSDEAIEQLVRSYCGQESEAASQLFRQSLHAALTIDEIRQLAGGLGIPAQHVQMSSDRHWTIDWRAASDDGDPAV
jgi:ubiquinone/menaquinone biosynthesis C-methylase UbiE